MSKIKNGWLDQHGTEPFKQQQFGTAGTEEVTSTEPRVGSGAVNIEPAPFPGGR